MRDHWTHRLSEYLDGELDAAERAACAAHLEACPRCAATLEDLREVVAGAALLPDVPPGRDLWPELERRLPPRRPVAPERDPGVVPLASRRRVTLAVPQLIAAAIALVVLSAGSAWLFLSGPVPEATAPSMAMGPSAGEPAADGPAAYPAASARAVNDLETEFDRRRPQLDPETIRVVERNLAIIDGAIAEAREALASDPSSTFLNTHLLSTMRQKVDLLRQAASIEATET